MDIVVNKIVFFGFTTYIRIMERGKGGGHNLYSLIHSVRWPCQPGASDNQSCSCYLACNVCMLSVCCLSLLSKADMHPPRTFIATAYSFGPTPLQPRTPHQKNKQLTPTSHLSSSFVFSPTHLEHVHFLRGGEGLSPPKKNKRVLRDLQ